MVLGDWAGESQKEPATQEAQLVAGLRAGDAAAAGECYQRYALQLRAFTTRQLAGQQELAEEITLQALADAMRNISRFDARKASLRAWLFGIVRRYIALEQRRKVRRKSIPQTAQVSFESLPDQSSTGDVAIEVTARIAASRQVMRLRQYLTAIEMEVLVLQCVHELSVREIAHSLGRSEKAIESLLGRAKTKARERLGEDER
jgi:RNA polymerase sigma-70 factor, ECF subfamily